MVHRRDRGADDVVLGRVPDLRMSRRRRRSVNVNVAAKALAGLAHACARARLRCSEPCNGVYGFPPGLARTIEPRVTKSKGTC